jgi:steroid 5-alpha reductase family enzyme
MLATLISVGGLITLFVSALFVLSVIFERNDIADVAWGLGIALVAFSAWLLGGMKTDCISLTTLTLITIWAIRLSIRIYHKNRYKTEDARYARWREVWGAWFFVRSYFQVFLLQGMLMMVVGYSAIHASVFTTDTTTPFFYLGVTVWLIGFIIESISDYQLDSFLENPENKGQLMQYGLWHYSRHPNYFGEVTMWWGIWLIITSLPLSIFALISPLTITALILFVSGIPLLEAGLAKHPAFAEYKRTTSVFIPWWPKR